MSKTKSRVGTYLFLFTASILIFFSSGFIESQDSWLYTSVSRNLYYHHQWQAAPNEYGQRLNVPFNSVLSKNGAWVSPTARGYSLLMVPAVALSDWYHHWSNLPIASHFPLEDDWSFHLAASWLHAVWGATLAWLVYLYARNTGFAEKESVWFSLGIFFLSNLFPLAGDSFTHILQLVFYLAIIVSWQQFQKNQNKWWLLSLPILIWGLSEIYNQSYALLLPGLAMYGWLTVNAGKNKNHWLKWLFLGGVFVAGIYYFPTLISLSKRFRPTVFIDGAWGLLFSPGKSIFLYNPLLLLPLLFYRRLKKSPELLVLILTTVLYVFFYAQAYITSAEGIIIPIWNGGLNWGVRYLAPIVLLGMLVTMRLVIEHKLWRKRIIFLPLLIGSIYVQTLGTILPYQTQHRGLPQDIEIGDNRIDRYNYSAYLPGFSPILIQTKELAKKIIKPEFSLFSREKYYYYDHGTEPWGDISSEKNIAEYWQQWRLKGSIYENTFDFWWLRPFYYQDLPHGLVLGMFITNLGLIYIAGRKLFK